MKQDMILCIGITMSSIVRHDITNLDIVTRNNGMEIALVSWCKL